MAQHRNERTGSGWIGAVVASLLLAAVATDTRADKPCTGSNCTIGGGISNSATGTDSTVGGGRANSASFSFSVVGGGHHNFASNQGATVGGGENNTSSGTFGTVSGGHENIAGIEDTVGGGRNNVARGVGSTIGGGELNTANGTHSAIAGGVGNSARGARATIAGGGRSEIQNAATGNRATDDYATVGGGGNNQAGDNDDSTTNNPFATVGGGESNTASGAHSIVGGGLGNIASAPLATVGGGGRSFANDPKSANRATDFGATVGGGAQNQAGDNAGTPLDRPYATVGGGRGNVASGAHSVIAGGFFNQATAEFAGVGGGGGNVASGFQATIAGGANNIASGVTAYVGGGGGNVARGLFATVAGGVDNLAQGSYSFAAGRQAKATADGGFVWADSQPFDFNIGKPNRFDARSTGGVRFVTAVDATGAPTAGVEVPPGGGAWSSVSDRAVKINVQDVDPRDILQRLVSVPIQRWSYAAQGPAILHLGPMAQDFAAAFEVGEDDKHISTVDADGVALAAIQGLNAKVEQREAELQKQIRAQDAEITALRDRLAQLETDNAESARLKGDLAELRRTVEALMVRTSPDGRVAQAY